jgi:hypothetical protein
VTAVHPDDKDWNSQEDAVYDKPKRRKAQLDIPEIKPLSLLGLESIAWGLVIAHLVKWAVSFAYFATWQVRYAVGYGSTTFTVIYWKDFWDRLPVHAANLLGQHWFPGQAAPEWWITWRHDIRDVGIAVIATIIVRLLFAKPKYPADDHPGLKVYLTRVPLAMLAALAPIAVIGVLAWKLPWLLRHGWEVPARYGALASEGNGWVAAGTWITVVMGIAGGVVAGLVIHRIADDIQWFFAERSAGKIRSNQGLNALRGERVIGTPAHRKRVHWLLDHVTLSELPSRNPWLVRGLLVVGFLTLAAAGAGAWLNLAGPAAPH